MNKTLTIIGLLLGILGSILLAVSLKIEDLNEGRGSTVLIQGESPKNTLIDRNTFLVGILFLIMGGLFQIIALYNVKFYKILSDLKNWFQD